MKNNLKEYFAENSLQIFVGFCFGVVTCYAIQFVKDLVVTIILALN